MPRKYNGSLSDNFLKTLGDTIANETRKEIKRGLTEAIDDLPDNQVKEQLSKNLNKQFENTEVKTEVEIEVEPKIKDTKAVAQKTKAFIKNAVEGTKVEIDTSDVKKDADKAADSVVNAQEKIQEKIKETNQIIKNQQDWLKSLSIMEKDFATSGKKQATDQLRNAYNRLADFYRNEKDIRSYDKAYPEERAIYDWYNSYEEAKRQGVAQSSLSRYWSASGTGGYEEANKKLQEAWSYRQKVLTEESKKLDELENEYKELNVTRNDTAQNKVAASAPENTQNIEKEKNAVKSLKEQYLDLFEEKQKLNSLSEKYSTADVYYLGSPNPSMETLEKDGFVNLIKQYYDKEKAESLLSSLEHDAKEFARIEDEYYKESNNQQFLDNFKTKSFEEQLELFDKIAKKTKRVSKDTREAYDIIKDMRYSEGGINFILDDGKKVNASSTMDLGDTFGLYGDIRNKIKSIEVMDTWVDSQRDNLDYQIVNFNEEILKALDPLVDSVQKKLTEAFKLDDHMLTTYAKALEEYDRWEPFNGAYADTVIANRESIRHGLNEAFYSKLKDTQAPEELIETYNKLCDTIDNKDVFPTLEQAIEQVNVKAKQLGVTFDETTNTWVNNNRSQNEAQQESHETADAVSKEAENHKANADAIRDENNARRETEDIIDHGYLRRETGIDDDTQTRRYTEKINDFITKSVSPYYDNEGQLQQTVSYLWDYDKALNSITALDEKIIKQIHEIRGATEAEAAPMLTNLHILESQRKEAEDWIKKMVDSPTSNANESQLTEIERVRSAKREQLQAELRIKDAKAETIRLAKEEAKAEKETAAFNKTWNKAIAENTRRNERAQKAIDSLNKKLSESQIKLNNIQATYDKTVAAGVSKPVSDKDDLEELGRKREAILDEIDRIRKQGSADAQELINLDKLIADYKLLAKIKKDANNPTKREMGGQELSVAIEEELARYDKLIDKAEKYGIFTEQITQSLKTQREELSKNKNTDSYYDSQSVRKQQNALLDQELIKIEKRNKLHKEASDILEKQARIETEAIRKAIAEMEKEKALQDEINEAWRLAKAENRARDEKKRTDALQQVEKIYSSILDLETKITNVQTKDGDYSRELSVLQDQLKTRNIELFQASQIAKSLDDQFSLEKKKAEMRSQNIKLAEAEGNAARKTAEAEAAAQKAAEKKIHDARAKEYSNIFYKGDGKLREVEFAPNTEALRNSNALYDELEAKVKRVYDLKEASLKLDKDTLVGQDGIAKKDAEIAELKNRIVSIIKEISAAEAVQEEREKRLLEIDDERDGVLKDILHQQELQSRDQMQSSVNKWIDDIKALQNSTKYTQEFQERLKDTLDLLKSFNSATGSIDEVNAAFEKLSKNMKGINADKTLSDFKKAQSASIAKLNLQIEEFLRKNTRMGKDFERKFNSLKLEWDTSTSTKRLQELVAEFAKLKAEVTAADKLGAGFFDTLRQRAMGVNAQLIAQYLSWQDIIRYIRAAVDTVRELDSALTEMRKVSDESLDSLKKYQQLTFNMAGDIGATAIEIQNTTADWMRLGESLDDAAESAKAATVLLNVSEFENIDDATQALVSVSQAYKEIDKMDIIDVINNVGNNYAVATSELAQGLQDAAAVLKTQGNDLYEATALLTAGNAVTQDISKVAGGIRTISLRLAGTEEAKEELKEIGEEADDMIVGTSAKLQQIIKDYTAVASNAYKGVDILDANGNLRNTYNILLDISKIYQEIIEEDKKAGTNRAQALVETIAGKNRSNIAASILLKPQLLEDVYNTAKNSAGSAQEELDKYLESIEGHLKEFQNAVQELAFYLIDSGMINDVLDFATKFVNTLTEIVKLFDKLPGRLGTIATIATGAGLKYLILNLDKIPGKFRAIDTAVSEYLGEADIFIGETAGAINQIGTSSLTSSKYVRALGKALTQLASNPLTKVFLVAGIAYVAFDQLTTSVKEADKKVKETESDIESLSVEIKKLRDLDSPTEAQKKYLEALEKELSIKERILELDKKDKAEQTYKYTPAEMFDADNEYRKYLLKRTSRENPQLNGGVVYTAHESGLKIATDISLLQQYRTEMEKIDLSTTDGIRKYDEYQKKIDAITRKHFQNLSDVNRDILELQTAIDKAQSDIDNHYLEESPQAYENAQQIIKSYSRMIEADKSVIDAYERLTSINSSAISSDRVVNPVLGGIKSATDSVMANLEKGNSDLFSSSNLNSYLKTLYDISDALENGTELTKDQLTELRKYFDQLEKRFPQLKDDIVVLNEEFLQGTNVWADAIANVKKELTGLKLDELGDRFEKSYSEFDIPTDVKVEVSDDEFKQFESELNSLIKSDKDISIAVHADIADNISTISDMFNDINTAAANVQKNFMVSFNDLANLSSIFPGILEGMTVLKDGTVQLNKEIAQSAIDAAKAEADADAESAMDRLNTQANLLQAKADTYKEMAHAAAVLAGNEIDSEMTSDDARAKLSAGLAEIEQLNAQLTANEEQKQQKLVADSSQENGKVVASNWAEAWQEALNNAIDFANGAVTAQNNAANGDKTGSLKVRGSSFSGSSGTSNETNLLAETKDALEETATTAQKVFQDLETRYLEAAAVAEKAAGAAKDGIQLIKASRQFTESNLKGVKEGKAGRTTPETLEKAKNDNSGKSKEKKDDYKEFIDYFERMIKVLDNSIDLLEAHLQDVVGSFAKNTLLDAQEDQIKRKMAGYSSAVEMYSAKASEALSKIPSDVAAKLQSGAVSIDEFVGESNKDVVEAAQEYEKWADKVADCKKQIVELREQLRQLELTKFKNIAQDFQEIFDVRQTQIGLIEKTISLFEAASDKAVGRGFYDVQIDQTAKQLDSLYEKRVALINQANSAMAHGIDVASDEWFEMLNAIEDVNGAIIDAQKNIEDYKNAIVKLYVEVFETESKRYSKQISLRESAVAALDKQIAIIQSEGNVEGRAFYDEKIEQVEKEIDMLQEEREELTRKMNEATANGVKVSTDEWYQMVEGIQAVDSAIQDAQQNINEYKSSITKLYTDAFDREVSRYTSQIKLRQNSVEALEKQISIIEAAGNKAGAAYFEEQIEQTQKQIDMLVSERKALMSKMSEATANGVKVASDEWYSMVNSLNEVDSAIQDCRLAIENFDNAILALHTETFDRIQNRFSSLAFELSSLGDMYEGKDVATKDNNWTKEGLAQLGLLTQQYELSNRQVQQYNEEIAELNKQYEAGKYSVTEYADKLAELKSAQWDAVKSAKSAKDSIVSINKARVDIVVDGIEKEISEYKKIIDAQKEMLSSEKELHDYEKSINESVKEIADIEKQISALSGDTSLSANARRAKLEEELRDARESLAEEEYNHSIEMQQDALSQQAENYEDARNLEIETLQESLNNEELIISDSFARVKENTAVIASELLLMAQQLNIDMSKEIIAPWQSGENAIAAYGTALSTQSSAFIQQLAAVEASEWRLQDQANRSSVAISEMFGNTADELVTQTSMATEAMRQEEIQSQNSSRAIADMFGNQADNLVEQAREATDAIRDAEQASRDAAYSIANAFGQRADGLVATIESARASAGNLERMSNALGNSLSNTIDGSYSGASAASALNSIADAANGVADAARNAASALRSMMDAKASEPTKKYTIVDSEGNLQGFNNTTKSDLEKRGFKVVGNKAYAYAKGTKGVPYNQLAWTQEDGPEAIINPADGSILTPLKKGSAVLPTDQTSNIWEWSRFNPDEFASKLIQSIDKVEGGKVQTNTMQVGSLVTVNGNVNDTMEMMQIAANTASSKIKQSFNELSNSLNK